jgi:hypothetical protein
LFIFAGNEVDTEGEVINGSILSTDIKNLNLGFRDTTTETRFDVRLVLTITIATSRT